MVPEFGLATEAAQLDHRQGEIKVIVLGFLHNSFVQFERGHVLRGVVGDQPAVVTDRDKDTNFHVKPSD
ncbi:Uncharacterised protein [Klebsiella pneumoniae]|nr:Uncharacterised protein [Klebsiella pneumoniae]